MSDPIYSKERLLDPIHTPHGEIIYELIGQAEDHGGSEGHSLAHVHVPAGKASRPHYHLKSEESFYILEGRARMIIDGRVYLLVPGEACLISPGQVH